MADNSPKEPNTLPAKERVRQMKAKLEIQFREDWENSEKQKLESSGAVEAALRFIVH